jgi:prolyl-tRNA synthetase
MVPGDRELNEHKLARVLGGAELKMADEATILKATQAPVGFAGPVGLAIPAYADFALRGRSGVVTGANKTDTHLRHVDLARDARIEAFHDLAVAREGDPCPRCAGRLSAKRGIEVGHVFKLGTKYSTSFGACYLDEAGQEHVAIMGCYGIGVTRTLQAVIEQTHDADGLIWPDAIAPYTVALLVLNMNHAASVQQAETLYADLQRAGVEVFYDDRDERPGVKFKDADLLGFPLRVVISERTLAGGNVEVKRRTGTEKILVPQGEAVQRIVQRQL